MHRYALRNDWFVYFGNLVAQPFLPRCAYKCSKSSSVLKIAPSRRKPLSDSDRCVRRPNSATMPLLMACT
jgi:hypothetical protein